MEHTGSIMKYVSLTIAIGIGVGLGVSGQIIEHTASFNTLVRYAMSMLLISLILVTLLNRKFDQQPNIQKNTTEH